MKELKAVLEAWEESLREQRVPEERIPTLMERARWTLSSLMASDIAETVRI